MVDYYSNHADEFIETTISCDMSVQYDLFRKYVKDKSKILDVGFGSARDMLYFKSIGFDVYGIDACEEFVKRATNMGLNAKLVKVEDITYINEFDGIWACASLLHCEDLVRALNKCYDALKDNGIMYVSFKYGDFKGIRKERYFIDLDEESIKEVISNTCFNFVDCLLTSDVRPNRSNEKWLNVILRK